MDWIEFESMKVDRAWFTLTTLGDKILAAGGNTPQGYVLCLFLFVLKTFLFFIDHLAFFDIKKMDVSKLKY